MEKVGLKFVTYDCIRYRKFCTGALQTKDKGRNEYFGLPRKVHIGNRPKWMNKIAKNYIKADDEGPFARKFHIVVYTAYIYQVVCLKFVLIMRTIS